MAYTLSYSLAGLAGIPQVPQGSGQVGFACTPFFCYTSGIQYRGVFEKLQGLLNTLARVNRIPMQIPTSGKIDGTTVQLAQKLAYMYMGRNQPTLSTLILTDGGTKEDISKNAPEIISAIERIIYKSETAGAVAATMTVAPNAGTQVPTGVGPGGKLPEYTVLTVTPPAGPQPAPPNPPVDYPQGPGPNYQPPAPEPFVPVPTAAAPKVPVGWMIMGAGILGAGLLWWMDRSASKKE
jgi:hypothetical protein